MTKNPINHLAAVVPENEIPKCPKVCPAIRFQNSIYWFQWQLMTFA